MKDYLVSLIENDSPFDIELLADNGNWSIEEDNDEWIQDGKYQFRETVVFHSPTQTYYMITDSRSGSYHTEYFYNRPDIKQVQKTVKVITKTVWK